MKRVFLSLAVIAMIGLASCDKEKTCKCTTESNGLSVESEEIIQEGDCSDLNTNQTVFGVTTKKTCVEE